MINKVALSLCELIKERYEVFPVICAFAGNCGLNIFDLSVVFYIGDYSCVKIFHRGAEVELFKLTISSEDTITEEVQKNVVDILVDRINYLK